MIDVIKQTPSVYSEQSRDYQILARLLTVLYNDNKVYADNMNVWNNNIDNRLSELRGKTINFDTKHQWDYDVLDATVSCFKHIMMVKGTKTALNYCINILMRSYNLVGEMSSTIDQDGYTYILNLPDQLATLGVVQDLLDYVLPAGISYRVKPYKKVDEDLHTKATPSDSFGLKTTVPSNKMGIYNGSTSSADNQGYSLYRDSVINSD